MKIFMSVAIRRKDCNFPSIRFTLEKFYTWTNFLVFAVCRLRKLFKGFLFTSDKALTCYERDKNFCIEGRASDSEVVFSQYIEVKKTPKTSIYCDSDRKPQYIFLPLTL